MYVFLSRSTMDEVSGPGFWMYSKKAGERHVSASCRTVGWILEEFWPRYKSALWPTARFCPLVRGLPSSPVHFQWLHAVEWDCILPRSGRCSSVPECFRATENSVRQFCFNHRRNARRITLCWWLVVTDRVDRIMEWKICGRIALASIFGRWFCVGKVVYTMGYFRSLGSYWNDTRVLTFFI